MENPMQKLDLNSLEVETFSTMGFEPDSLVAFNNTPGVSQGPECTQTLVVSCTTCNCHTPAYDCV
jgi:hypothetical protein